MALIGGYVAPQPLDADELRRGVRSFHIVRSDREADFDHTIVATRSGHVFAKARPARPLAPRVSADEHGNVLVTLGFLCDAARERLDAARLLRACVDTAGRALEECEGEFVALFASAADGALHVVNDRFASRPCYLLARDATQLVSTNIALLLALARCRPQPDPLGWVQVGTLAHSVGARTTVRDVQRLLPGSHVTLRPGERQPRRYWRLEHAPREDALDPVKHGEETFEAFRQGAVFRTRLAAGGLVPLSGGLDSRLVAGAVPPDAGYSAFTFVDFPTRESTEQTRAAAEVARALGLPHHVARGEAPYSRHAEDVVRLTGGLRPLHHAAVVMLYLEAMARLGARFMLGGGPGDSLAGAAVPSARYTDPAAMEACIDDFCRSRMRHLQRLRLVMRDDVVDGCAAPLRASLEDSIRALGGPTAAHRATAWKMVERQPAFTFTSIVHAHPDVGEAFCHLDYRYVELMLQLPAAWLYRRSFYRVMIHTALPQLRHVPYTNTGELLTGALLEARDERPHPIRVAARRVLAGIRSRVLPPDPDVHEAQFRKDRRLIDAIREGLHAHPALRDILDVARCDRYLDDYAAGRRRGAEPFGTLATMCLAPGALA